MKEHRTRNKEGMRVALTCLGAPGALAPSACRSPGALASLSAGLPCPRGPAPALVVAGGLGDLTVRELRERAAAVGVDAQAIEEARDAHDPRAAMIALIEIRGNTNAFQGP